MKNFVGFTLGCLFAFLSSGITPLMAQDAAVNELVITGTVKNKDSRKKLENVNVSVVGNNIGTVTNADGTFSLKVAEAEAFRGYVRHEVRAPPWWWEYRRAPAVYRILSALREA